MLAYNLLKPLSLPLHPASAAAGKSPLHVRGFPPLPGPRVPPGIICSMCGVPSAPRAEAPLGVICSMCGVPEAPPGMICAFGRRCSPSRRSSPPGGHGCTARAARSEGAWAGGTAPSCRDLPLWLPASRRYHMVHAAHQQLYFPQQLGPEGELQEQRPSPAPQPPGAPVLGITRGLRG